MQAYAIYRLPHEDHATIIRQKAGDPVELQSLSDLNGRCGFVVAPFEVNGDQPVVLIEGEKEIVPICHHERSRENSWTSQAAEPSAPRAALGRDDNEGREEPIIINSGYRSPAVNKAIGGVPTSNHLTGCAADIHVAGIEQLIRYATILLDISDESQEDFDELLIERSPKGSYWLHFAVRPSGNRRKVRLIQT